MVAHPVFRNESPVRLAVEMARARRLYRDTELPAKRLRSAVGRAATQAAGVLKALRTMAKPLHAGKAAMNGLEDALLAQHGPAAPIGGHRGDAAFAFDSVASAREFRVAAQASPVPR